MPQNIITRALIASAVLAGLAAPAAADQASVATTAIVEHPALDAARDGRRHGLARFGEDLRHTQLFTDYTCNHSFSS